MDGFHCKVFVRCFTYNQSFCIKDTMDGFCMQQTDFPFVCAIVDDASTDGEPEVIRKYLKDNFIMDDNNYFSCCDTEDYHRIFVQHKTNKHCFFDVIFLNYNHYRIRKNKLPYMSEWLSLAEYQAMCEGDDYWIDAHKLQKQVDFMDAHTNHSMCCHATIITYPDGKTQKHGLYNSSVEQCSVDKYILGGFGSIRLNTVLYRTGMYSDFAKWAINAPLGDGPICLTLFEDGMVAYSDEAMSKTRVNVEGSWHQRQEDSFKSRHSHYVKVIKLWRQFDKWSKRKHHKVIQKKIWINKKKHYVGDVMFVLSKIKHSMFN